MNIVLHLDQHLLALISQLGVGFYFLMFFVLFAETGLVVTPFLPGDSLLFALGALSALGGEQGPSVSVMAISLTIAAIIGNSVNYYVGKKFGQKILERYKLPFVKPEYIERTKDFFAEHGNKTIFLARFVPLIRTLAPFVAGVGQMKSSTFFFYNWFSAVVWVPLFLALGYFFGNLSWVKQQFHWVTIGIVLISLVPAAVAFLRKRNAAKT